MPKEKLKERFYKQFPELKDVDEKSPYAKLLKQLQKTANDYFNGGMCKIIECDMGLIIEVPLNDVKETCQDIWDNPEKYSDYQAGTESAYYDFLKYLYVEFPDGEAKELTNLVDM
jgi:hypothetical protein